MTDRLTNDVTEEYYCYNCGAKMKVSWWCDMKRTEYYRGKPNTKYGIWNNVSKQFQFNISEDTPFLAIARLYQRIGDDAKKARFEAKKLPMNNTEEHDWFCEMLMMQNIYLVFVATWDS